MTNLSKIVFLFGIIGFIAFSCEKDDDEPIKLAEGYIVGFDPCTINHHYRIGYVIISTDLKDTLVTYNLSDSIYKMPANVISNISDTLYKNISDTLYKIPESYFQNYRNSTYFPDSLRYKYEVKILYLIANENEMIFNLCTTDILFLHFIQVIIKSATN